MFLRREYGKIMVKSHTHCTAHQSGVAALTFVSQTLKFFVFLLLSAKQSKKIIKKTAFYARYKNESLLLPVCVV